MRMNVIFLYVIDVAGNSILQLDEMMYMDITISIFVKQYHYILNEKKVKSR